MTGSAERRLRLAPDLDLPVEAVTETFAFIAKRGAGKTYAASVLVEELLKARLRVVVLDPKGDWWGLRSSADGKSAGFPIVILGGDHGDIPLEAAAGHYVADLVVDERLSMVVDLSAFSKGDMRRFVTDFAERLYHRNREPLHVVLEEAHRFIPQRIFKGDERMVGAVGTLAEMGRGRGIGVTLCSQRSATVNKNILTQTETLVAMRTTSPQDRKVVDEWIREQYGEGAERDEVLGSLASLANGDAWVWSPSWLGVLQRIHFRRRETFDSSATPRPGQSRPTPKTLADVDLAAVKEAMAETIERARADDPAELRRQLKRAAGEVADLRRQLERNNDRLAELVAARAAEPERVEVAVLDETLVERLSQAVQTAEATAAAVLDAVRQAKTTAGRHTPAAPAPKANRPAPARPAAASAPAEPAEPSTLVKGERKMLEALARRHPVAVTKAQLSTLSGFAPKGGTFRTYLSTLRRQGLIEETDLGFVVTAAGWDAVGENPGEPQTTDELLAMWRGALVAGERSMLDELVAAYPDSLTKADLADRTGFALSGGTFRTYLSTLRRNGLADVAGDRVTASGALFV